MIAQVSQNILLLESSKAIALKIRVLNLLEISHVHFHVFPERDIDNNLMSRFILCLFLQTKFVRV